MSSDPSASRVAAPLQTHSRRFWFRYQAASGLAAAAERHVELIRGIVSGDARAAVEEAKRLMGLLYRHAEAVASPLGPRGNAAPAACHHLVVPR